MCPAYPYRVIARPQAVAISRYNLMITYAPKSIEYRSIYNDITTFPYRTASQEIATACGLAMTYSFCLPSAVTNLLSLHFGGSKPPPYAGGAIIQYDKLKFLKCPTAPPWVQISNIFTLHSSLFTLHSQLCALNFQQKNAPAGVQRGRCTL